MEPLTREEKIKTIKNIFWDYTIDPEEYLDIVEGTKQGYGWTTRDRILVRMFERLQWYTLVAFFGIKRLKNIITPEVIVRLHFPFMRRKYEYIRKILHGEPVSDSGWNHKGDKKFTFPIVSNRWYSAK